MQSSQKTALSSASWAWGWNKSSHRRLHLPATKPSQGSGLLCLRAPVCSLPGTAGFPQGPEQDPRSPVELPSCRGSFWSRIHSRPRSEPLAAGFSFTHEAVAQCWEAVGIWGRCRQQCRRLPAPPEGSGEPGLHGRARVLPAPPPGIMRPHAAGGGPAPCPTWVSPDSATVTGRSLQPLPQHTSGTGNAPFDQSDACCGLGGARGGRGCWNGCGCCGTPMQAVAGSPLRTRVGVRGCGLRLRRQEGS